MIYSGIKHRFWSTLSSEFFKYQNVSEASNFKWHVQTHEANHNKCDPLFCLWDYGVNTSRVLNACYVVPMSTKSIGHRLLQSDSTVSTLYTYPPPPPTPNIPPLFRLVCVPLEMIHILCSCCNLHKVTEANIPFLFYLMCVEGTNENIALIDRNGVCRVIYWSKDIIWCAVDRAS